MTTFVQQYDISNFWHIYEKKSDHSVSNICPALHTAAIDFLSIGDSTGTSHR